METPKMARPKGSKDKKPRKPKKLGPDVLLPVEALIKRIDPKNAPNGLTVRGFPKARKTKVSKAPKTTAGKKALQDHLIANGLLKPEELLVTDGSGRPMIHLDPEEVKSLAKFGPTLPEIAAHFKVSQTVLERYKKEIAEGRELGRLMIRKKARILAMEGNVPMLLHACKHSLDEQDKASTTNIAVVAPTAFQAPKLNAETARLLTEAFVSICPDPAKFLDPLEVQGSYEVQDA